MSSSSTLVFSFQKGDLVVLHNMLFRSRSSRTARWSLIGKTTCLQDFTPFVCIDFDAKILSMSELPSVWMYVLDTTPGFFCAKVSFICVASISFLKPLCTVAPFGLSVTHRLALKSPKTMTGWVLTGI